MKKTMIGLLLVLMAAGLYVSTPAQAHTDPYFSSSITPTTSNIGETKEYTLTITNEAYTHLDYIQIQKPSGFTAHLVTAVSGVFDREWVVWNWMDKIYLHGPTPPYSSEVSGLSHNEILTITFTATPYTAGGHNWIITGTGTNSYGDEENFYRLPQSDVTETRSPAYPAGDWINGYFALGDEGGYAYSDRTYQEITFYNFGFSLPSGAHIKEAKLYTDMWQDSGGDTKLWYFRSYDNGVTWDSWSEATWRIPPPSESRDYMYLNMGSPSGYNSIQVKILHYDQGWLNDRNSVYIDYIYIQVIYNIPGLWPMVTVSEPLDYQLTVNTNPASVDSPTGGGTYAQGTEVSISTSHTLSISDGARYHFDHWSSSGGGTFLDASDESTTFITPAATATLTANYMIEYMLTITTNTGTTDPTVGDYWYPAGTTLTITAWDPTHDTDEQYVWKGWIGSGTGSYTGMKNPASGAVTMDGPITETASWTHQYYLTVNDGGHGTAGGADWYVAGTTAYATMTPLTVDGITGTRYVFAGWSGDASGSGSPSNGITMNGPKTATATWTTQYELTMATNFGTTDPTIGDGHWYTAGSFVTIETFAPSAGAGEKYVWNGWTGSGTGSYTGMKNPASGAVTMDGPITETASWTHQYYVTFASNGVGSDFSETVMRIDTVAYDKSGASFWWDSSSTHSFAFQSPLMISSNTQYFWISTSGLSTSKSSTTLVISGPGSVTGNYKKLVLTYTGQTSGQYSDPVSVSATVFDWTSGTGIPVENEVVKFDIGSQWVSATTLSNGKATASITLIQPSGSDTVTATLPAYPGPSVSSSIKDSAAFTINKEIETITYNGNSGLMVGPGPYSVTLSAKLSQQNDGNPGTALVDVQFLLFSSNNLSNTPTQTVTVTGVDPDGIASKTISLSADIWTIIVQIDPANKYWTQNEVPIAVLTTTTSTTGSTNGGGWIPDLLSSNGKGNFGFSVQYSKNTGTKGSFVYVYRTNTYDYVVKSNSWQGGGLSFSDINKATFTGKCVIQVRDKVTGVLITSYGNSKFTVSVIDKDQNQPQSTGTDTISISFTAGTTGNANTNRDIASTPISGGNINVRKV